jgi:HK97 gp10 family phage protein
MELKFETLNLDELAIELEQRITESNKRSLQKACALVEGDAKRLAPKDTGALRRSITSKVDYEGSDLLVGEVFTPLEYAPYVEFGTGLFAEEGGRKNVPWAYEDEKTGELIFTSGQHPQPYLRPALENNREKILTIIKEDLND